jgi:hypothetical protein
VHRVEVRDAKGRVETARVELKYRRVHVLPPVDKQKRYPALTLTVIHARERATPADRPAIDWKLITWASCSHVRQADVGNGKADQTLTLRQVVTEGFDQVAFHANRISRLVDIGGPQLAIGIGIGQQPDRLTAQEYRRRHRPFAQPWRVGIPVGLALSRPMLRAFTRAAEPATARPSVKAVSAGWPRRSATTAAHKVSTGAPIDDHWHQRSEATNFPNSKWGSGADRRYHARRHRIAYASSQRQRFIEWRSYPSFLPQQRC